MVVLWLELAQGCANNKEKAKMSTNAELMRGRRRPDGGVAEELQIMHEGDEDLPLAIPMTGSDGVGSYSCGEVSFDSPFVGLGVPAE